MSHANNKDADEPVHPLRLISIFIVRCLDRIVPKVVILQVSRGRICLTWAQTTEDSFSHDVAHI